MHRLRPCPVPPRPVFGRPRRACARAAGVALTAVLALAGGCGGGGSIEAPPGLGLPPAPVTPAPAADAPLACVSQGSSVVRTERVHTGLNRPWAMAFLPDQRVLVTQKPGSMVLVSADGALRTTLAWDPLAGPQIRDGGQGGLLDLALDPDYLANGWIYFSYQEPGATGQSGTAIARVRLRGTTLGDFQRLYQQLVGALAGQRLWRLELGADARVTRCEALLGGLDARIRDLRLGPDGWPWILTDAGEIHRIRR